MLPTLLGRLMSAPMRCRCVNVYRREFSTARCTGVSPYMFWKLMSAPPPSSSCIARWSPLATALCSGVEVTRSVPPTGAPCLSSSRTHAGPSKSKPWAKLPRGGGPISWGFLPASSSEATPPFIARSVLSSWRVRKKSAERAGKGVDTA